MKRLASMNIYMINIEIVAKRGKRHYYHKEIGKDEDKLRKIHLTHSHSFRYT